MALEAHVPTARSADHPLLVVELDEPAPARVALLSGSFDPITIGHAALAEAASLWADLVVVVYSVRTMGKESPVEAPLLSESARLRSIEAFCRSRPKIEPGLCSHGLLVDQVRAARGRFPRAELRLVVGSDKLLQLLDPRWYEDRDAALDDLFREATVMYAAREGEGGEVNRAWAHPGNERWRGSVISLNVPPAVAAVSSRLVRSLLRRGRDVRHLVPVEVMPFLPDIEIQPGWE